eukprot:GILJ01006545.1.p1 GENE.GILJ01006545.1~~GILJ01006545.1.p1  ORF type:complete len:664 (+),score=78.57 GILJ01006545.1:33-1994(+)
MSGLMRSSVRILVVGDEQVGKTSLISTVVSEIFPEKVPAVQHPVVIPAELNSDRIYLTIVDSSSRPEDKSKTVDELRLADVVVLVYAVDRAETFTRVATYWLPEIKKYTQENKKGTAETKRALKVPVVLVGNKLDTRGQDTHSSQHLQHNVLPVLQQFEEVETCLECSAKAFLNISEVFYAAQKAVLFPTAPLFDAAERALKPAFEKAVRRVFRLCDKDKDGVLSDEELDGFQFTCFGAHLDAHELEGIKLVIRNQTHDGVTPQGITLAGFQYLHKLFIEKTRSETSWTVLRHFGYGDDLHLRPDIIDRSIRKADDQSVELTDRTVKFLTELFQQFNKSQDGWLSNEEIEDMFSVMPSFGLPWGSNLSLDRSTVTTARGLPLQGWLSLWHMTTLLQYKTTFRYLPYLGFPHELDDAVKITGRRFKEMYKNRIRRDVIHCYIFGAPKCGKTYLLDSLIGRPFETSYTPTSCNRSVCNALKLDKDKETKYLVMTEYPEHEVTDVLTTNMEQCDVACLVYSRDAPDSFAYLIRLCNMIPRHVPIVFVETKADLPSTRQSSIQTPQEFCDAEEYAAPIRLSVKTDDTSALFRKLVDFALHPKKGVPAAALARPSPFSFKKVLLVSLLGVIAGGLAWKFYFSKRMQSASAAEVKPSSR